MKYRLLHIALILLFILTACSDKEKQTIKRTTVSMGTLIEIQVKGAEENEANAAITKAFAEFERLNEKYSTYKNDNFMWSLNQSDAEYLEVDDETFFLLMESGKLNEATEGGFDPAIGGLIDLLGFEKGSPEMPKQNKVLEALEHVGWKHIELKEPNTLVRKKKVHLNFSAVVKGYAVDRACEILEQEGMPEYLVNAGGEIKGKGEDWKIGIQHPRERNSLLGKLIVPNGMGVATSGDYEQYFNKEGKRYSHIINPVTGYPATETQAVTVIAKDVLTADALATGVFVQEPAKGMEIIETLPDAECLIVKSTGEVIYSSGFDKYFRR